MKLLYISSLVHKKGSSASIRNISLINGLAELGHDVHVLTIKYPSLVQDKYLIAQTHSNVKIDEIDAGFISKFIPNSSNKKEMSFPHSAKAYLKKVVKDILFFPDIDKSWIQKSKLFSINNIDIIVSSSDTKTSHFVAQAQKQHHSSIPWVQIWGDPWATDIASMSFLKRLRSSYYEKKLLKAADSVLYVSEPTLREMQVKLPDVKMGFLPRGYLQPISRNCSEKRLNYRIAYTGVLEGRRVEPILEAIKSFNAYSEIPIQFEIFGRMSLEQSKIVDSYEFAIKRGVVSMEVILDCYQSVDILLFIGNSAKTTQIPGKLYDYFGTECVILALVEDLESEVATFIENTKRCNLFLNDIERIDLKYAVEQINTKSIVEKYSPKSIAKTMLEIIEGQNQ